MIKYRQLLTAYLRTIHPRVYFEPVSDKAQYPYLVIDMAPSFDDGEGTETVPVEIDGWDAPADGDTMALEELMSRMNGDGNIKNPTGLDKRTLTDGKIYVTFHLESKAPLTDPDTRIRRRKYRYTSRIYKGVI